MTDGADDSEADARRTMADVSHANPRTGETLGEVFRRGPAVADGGEPGDRSRDDDSGRTMGDVDHTPPNADVNDVWSRGHRTAGGREDV